MTSTTDTLYLKDVRCDFESEQKVFVNCTKNTVQTNIFYSIINLHLRNTCLEQG